MEDSNQSNDSIDISLKCASGGIVVILYIIGVYLHVKLIKISNSDRHMTWMMDIANSILILCSWAHLIIMHILTYMISDLHNYTGLWFCYASKALTIISNAHIGGHSFIIAMMKYVVIVFHDKVRCIGIEKAKIIFLVINVLYPVYMFSVFNIINPDFLFIYGSVSQANRCLGESEIFSGQDPNKTIVKLHDICEFSEPFDSWSVMKVLRLIRSMVCYFHVALIYLFLWNVIEAFVYYFVFKFMWR